MEIGLRDGSWRRGGLLIRLVAQAQPRSKTPAEWAEQLCALQRSMPMGHSVVRQMRDEEL